MIKEWIAEYKPRNTEEASQALREIMQEIAFRQKLIEIVDCTGQRRNSYR
jgi:hypothetical protein